MTKFDRLRAVLTLASLWAVTYVGARWLTPFAPTLLPHDPVSIMPVVPIFVIAYLSFYLMPLVAAWTAPDAPFLRRLVQGGTFITLVSG